MTDSIEFVGQSYFWHGKSLAPDLRGSAFDRMGPKGSPSFAVVAQMTSEA